MSNLKHLRKRAAFTNGSTRMPRCEVLGLCETIYAASPLSVFGTRVLGLFLCVCLPLNWANTDDLYSGEQAPPPGERRQSLWL